MRSRWSCCGACCWIYWLSAARCVALPLRAAIQHSQQPPWSLRAIDAGLARTGTETLTAALSMLGYHPTHGGDLVRQNSSGYGLWYRSSSWEDKIKWLAESGYDAMSDSPYNYYYKDLMAIFPASKVILSVHPHGAEAWVESADRNAKQVAANAGDFVVKIPAVQRVVPGTACAIPTREPLSPEMRETCVRAYEQHNEEVRQAVPAERLVEFNVSQGWGELCKGLGISPEPAEHFPRVDWTRATLILDIHSMERSFSHDRRLAKERASAVASKGSLRADLDP